MVRKEVKIVVIDGETFKCNIDGKTRTILLHDVDAPKVGEPFTKELAKRLEKLLLGKDKYIYLEPKGISWGEIVCIVRVDGESTSVNDRINSYLNKMKQSLSISGAKKRVARGG